MSQADAVKFRGTRLNTADTVVTNGPTDGQSIPHFQMSPIAPSGMPTLGFTFMLKAPSAGAAIAGAGGFNVTAWFRDPNTQMWASSVTAAVAFNQLWICSDVDAMEGVIFQIGNVGTPGLIDVHFAEQ